MAKTPLLLSATDRTNLFSALHAVRGCYKTASVLWMRVMGLPCLDGVVLSTWNPTVRAAVVRFYRSRGYNELLLRIDKPNQRWTRRRGGYLVSAGNIQRELGPILREGFCVLLLDPASPYADLASFGILALPEEHRFLIEVVGPGFDASDILRGDTNIHERWEVPFDAAEGGGRRTFLIGNRPYRLSVEQRLVKIGARLENPAFPKSIVEMSATKRAKLRARATRFLEGTGSTKLLEHTDAYAPVSRDVIAAVASPVHAFLCQLSAYGVHLGTTSFSASLLPRFGLRFWDFFSAEARLRSAVFPEVKFF